MNEANAIFSIQRVIQIDNLLRMHSPSEMLEHQLRRMHSECCSKLPLEPGIVRFNWQWKIVQNTESPPDIKEKNFIAYSGIPRISDLEPYQSFNHHLLIALDAIC